MFWTNINIIPNWITSIGDFAFYYCTNLKEVVIPPSVESIGENAFLLNSQLETIIMGHGVKLIANNAFDGCSATNIYITSQIPPLVYANSFSSYAGELWLQGKETAKAYHEDDCWGNFNSRLMVEPTELRIEGDSFKRAKLGDKIQLKATILPENVTLPYVFWRTSNPAVATVDKNGLVTIVGDDLGIPTIAEGDNTTGYSSNCKIIAETLYADGPVVEISVTDNNSTTELKDTTVKDAETISVYNINGVMVGSSVENLTSGIYIIRQGAKTWKLKI